MRDRGSTFPNDRNECLIQRIKGGKRKKSTDISLGGGRKEEKKKGGKNEAVSGGKKRKGECHVKSRFLEEEVQPQG